MPLFRPPNIKTISLLTPVFLNPTGYFLYEIIFDVKATSLIRPLLGSPIGGLDTGIFLLKKCNAKAPLIFSTKISSYF